MALTMASGNSSPKPEPSPLSPSLQSIPQKRTGEDDHQPAVSSPLNPDIGKSEAPIARERIVRSKKESLKKRESKVGVLAADLTSRATPDPKTKAASKQKPTPGTPAPLTQLAPLRYVLPPPKASDFEPPRAPTLTPVQPFKCQDGSEIQFYTTSDHVHNKKDYRYTHCIADPVFKASQYYRQSDAEPFGPRFSFEDVSKDICLDASGRYITTDKGWRMGRANVCVRSGRYYYECKVLKGVEYRSKEATLASGRHCGPAVRIGWARRETSLEVVVGSDAYSYALRDVKGEKVHMSRPKPYFPPGEEVQVGDIVGVEICLPSESFHRRIVDGSYNPAVDLEDDESNRNMEAAPIIRDRVPIRYKGQLYFEHMEYPASKELHEFVINPTPQTSSAGSGITGPAKLDLNPTNSVPALRTLPHSYVKYYKNGKDMGKAFTGLLAFLPPASNFPSQGSRSGLDDGILGYYPAVSVLRGSVAQINLGPDFWYPPPGYEDHDDEVDMVGSDQLPVVKADKVRAVSERLSEQVAEDIMYDMIDEVCNWVDDLARNGEGAPKAFQGLAMDEEIKELIQEED